MPMNNFQLLQKLPPLQGGGLGWGWGRNADKVAFSCTPSPSQLPPRYALPLEGGGSVHATLTENSSEAYSGFVMQGNGSYLYEKGRLATAFYSLLYTLCLTAV